MDKKKIYEAMDSFLVEAKDQHGNERSLERLNKDRHLFVKKMEKLLQDQLDEVIEYLDDKEIGRGVDELFDEGGWYENRQIVKYLKRRKDA